MAMTRTLSAITLALTLAAPATVLGQAEMFPYQVDASVDIRGGGDGEVGFMISGPLAETIFYNLHAPVEEDPCTGGTMKQEPGGLWCVQSPDGAVDCSLGYDFSGRGMTGGPMTC